MLSVPVALRALGMLWKVTGSGMTATLGLDLHHLCLNPGIEDHGVYPTTNGSTRADEFRGGT